MVANKRRPDFSNGSRVLLVCTYTYSCLENNDLKLNQHSLKSKVLFGIVLYHLIFDFSLPIYIIFFCTSYKEESHFLKDYPQRLYIVPLLIQK